MLLRVRPTPTRFAINSPIDKTLLHSISRMCHPWGSLLSAGEGVASRTPAWLGESEDEFNSLYDGLKRYICKRYPVTPIPVLSTKI